MLDRMEFSLRSADDLEAYAWLLDRSMDGQRYPSLRMLDRLDQAALAHELLTINDDEDDR